MTSATTFAACIVLLLALVVSAVAARASTRDMLNISDLQETVTRSHGGQTNIPAKITSLNQGTVPPTPTASVEAYPDCPAICNCILTKGDILTVNCSWRFLDTIPTQIPHRATVLNLQGNKLTTVPDFVFSANILLDELDLSQNNISTLNKFSFHGLKSLETLFLSGNRLAYNGSADVKVFMQVPRLKTLYIQNNCPDASQNCVYLDKVLAKATNLESLSMDGLPKRTLGFEFRNLSRLRKLSLNGKGALCQVNRLEKETFANINGPIEYLDLSNCNIIYVDRLSFQNLTSIKTVLFESNTELCVEGIRNISSALQSTKIEKLYLKRTCSTILPLIDPGIFSPLSSSNLTVLDIQRSHISRISQAIIATFPTSLQRFTISYNSINDAEFLLRLCLLPNLVWLDGSLQNHYSMDVGGNVTIHWPDPLPLPPKLKFLNVSYLKFNEYSFPGVKFTHNNKLEVVDASYDYLQNITGVVKGLRSLRRLYLQHNLIEYIYPMAFSDMPRLSYLDLSGNKIGTFANPSEHSFSKLHSLSTLRLSGNKIKDLHVRIFEDLVSIKYLFLDYNTLTVVNFDISAMSNLLLLRLDNNQLLNIESGFLSSLGMIGHFYEMNLTLAGNPFSCDCVIADRKFIRWMSQTKVNIVDRMSTQCTLMDGSVMVMTESNATAMVANLAIVCIWWDVLTGCVSTFIILTIVLSLCAVMYRQRWKLRYLYYTGKNKINPYHPLEEVQQTLDIDVYFSFDEGHLFPNGQSLYQILSVCLYREFKNSDLTVCIRNQLQEGRRMNDVISSSIHRSRKVMAFVSKYYCEDFWNIFEFNMAAYDGIYTNRNVIIPVLVGEISPRDLLPEVRAFLVNKSVIRVKSAEEIMQHVEVFVSKIQSD